MGEGVAGNGALSLRTSYSQSNKDGVTQGKTGWAPG